MKMVRSLPGDNEFVAYIDAVGELDGARYAMPNRLENHDQPLHGGTSGTVVARSPDDWGTIRQARRAMVLSKPFDVESNSIPTS